MTPAKRCTACPTPNGKPNTRKKPAPNSKRRSNKENPVTDLNTLRASLESGEHAFADTLAFIAEHYSYQPQAFTNGNVENAAGQNEGSCKTLGMAALEGLSDREALLAFGEHYRSVVATPDGSDHGNIRALIAYGLAGVKFAQQPLKRLA
ncbi:HopJ type III effector protein [Pseudomonas sp. 1121_17]